MFLSSDLIPVLQGGGGAAAGADAEMLQQLMGEIARLKNELGQE